LLKPKKKKPKNTILSQKKRKTEGRRGRRAKKKGPVCVGRTKLAAKTATKGVPKCQARRSVDGVRKPPGRGRGDPPPKTLLKKKGCPKITWGKNG